MIVRVIVSNISLENEIEATHKISKGNRKFTEVPHAMPKLNDGAVRCVVLPGCPSYYSTTSKMKQSRLPFEPTEGIAE